METTPPSSSPQPASTAHIYDAGGTDPDFYIPPTRQHRAPAFLGLMRSLSVRLVRAVRG